MWTLVVQWLVLCTFTAGGPGLIPGWGTNPRVVEDAGGGKGKGERGEVCRRAGLTCI